MTFSGLSHFPGPVTHHHHLKNAMSQLPYTSQSLWPVIVNAGDAELKLRHSVAVVEEPEDAANNNQFTHTTRHPVKALQSCAGRQQLAHQRPNTRRMGQSLDHAPPAQPTRRTLGASSRKALRRTKP